MVVAALLVVSLLAVVSVAAESPAVHTVVVVEVVASSKSGTECNEKEQTQQIALHVDECQYGSVDPDLYLRSVAR